MKHNILALLAALPLLACTPAGDKADTGEAIAQGAGVGNGPTGRVGKPVARGAEKGPIPADIDEGIEPAVNSSANVATSAVARAAKPTTIPAQFRGRWGINAADCKGDAAAKGLLMIEANRLVFYESRGLLDRVETYQPPSRFSASYRFSGEGQEWQRSETFTLNGARLERRTVPAADQSELVESLTYMRCPA